MRGVSDVTPGQFSLFRILFGAYLLQHFVFLLPDAAELFSNSGVLADPALNPTHGLFPNPLAASWAGPGFVTTFVAALAALSVMFTLGIARRTVALLLWFGWACLFNRNNLISNPSLPYVGLILVFCALVPRGESLSLGRADRSARPADWFFPAWIFIGAWFLMAAGYTFSGVAKLWSPSWVDGTAFHHLIDNPLARPGIVRDTMLALPPWCIAALTWSVLAAEITFLPLCAWRRGRMIAWTAMLAMHLGIALTVDFADLTFGMAMIHLFTFDPAWFPVRADARRPVLLYDGECGLCNAVVRFLMREDRPGRLSFAPLQSAPAQGYLERQGLPVRDFDSLVFVEDWNDASVRGGFKLRTAGVCAALDTVGGVWRPISWLRVIPAPVRDACYKLVARLRYRLFGEYLPSPLPDPNWERRIVR
jgi:predicted DCC family thiol-disulfide oxidoreductase YuxK